MIIGFFTDEIESSSIIYVINKKSDIPQSIKKKLKSIKSSICEIDIPGRIDCPFIDNDRINCYCDGWEI